MLAEAASSAFAKATAHTRSFGGGVPMGEAARINAASESGCGASMGRSRTD